MTDSSFNNDVIKIPFIGFISVVSELYPDKKSQKQFKSIMNTLDLMEQNKKLLKSLKLPFTDIEAIDLWDLILKLSKSLTSAISNE